MDLPVLHHQYIYAVGSSSFIDTSNNYHWRVRDVDYLPAQDLGTSATISTISNNRGGVTELSFEVTSLALDIGSGTGGTGFFLLLEFFSSSGWTGGSDPFATYTNTALDDE